MSFGSISRQGPNRVVGGGFVGGGGGGGGKDTVNSY